MHIKKLSFYGGLSSFISFVGIDIYLIVNLVLSFLGTQQERPINLIILPVLILIPATYQLIVYTKYQEKVKAFYAFMKGKRKKMGKAKDRKYIASISGNAVSSTILIGTFIYSILYTPLLSLLIIQWVLVVLMSIQMVVSYFIFGKLNDKEIEEFLLSPSNYLPMQTIPQLQQPQPNPENTYDNSETSDKR